MEVFVGQADLADVEAIVQAYQWLFDPPASTPLTWDPDRGTAALSRAISAETSAVFVATLDDAIVGFCTVYDDIESVRFGRRVWIEDLAVDPGQRSRGIGKRLLDEAKRWGKERGATRLGLESSEVRIDAHRFYEREQPDWRSLSFGWQL